MTTTPSPARPALLTSYIRWWKTTNRSMKTVENYGYILERFAAAVWSTDHPEPPTTRDLTHALTHARKHDIIEYIAGRLDGVSPATVSVDARAIRSFYDWLHAEGEIATNPAVGVKGPAVPETAVPMADETHYERLLATCRRRDSWINRRDAAIISMLWHGGFRRGELCVIDLRNLDLDAATVVLTKTKGARPRVVRLHPEATNLLDRFLRVRGDHDGPLFPSERRAARLTSNGIGQMMQRRCETAGVSISAHAFRRALAVRWRKADGSTSGLMAHAGWASEAMVRKYTRMAAEELAHVEYDRLFAAD